MSIKGYRELSETELEAINRIKDSAEEVNKLVEGLTAAQMPGGHMPDQRWVAIARTQLQQGFMALTRAVAKPTTF
jgi:hypothetical protein